MIVDDTLEPERDLAVARRITINGLPIINDRFNFFRAPMPNLDLYYRDCIFASAATRAPTQKCKGR